MAFNLFDTLMGEYPFPNFHFRVDFLFSSSGEKDYVGPAESAFQEVSGLKANLELEDYREMGYLGAAHGLLTGLKFDNLVLKRGVTRNQRLMNWIETSMEKSKAFHIPVLVSILNTEMPGTTLRSWMLYQAFPVSWNVGSFNAMNSEYLIETIELRYSYLTTF